MSNSNQLAMNPSRRKFLKVTGFAGGGLVLGVSLTGCGDSLPALGAARDTLTTNAFVQVRADNSVCFYCPRAEMGQGVTTGLTTLVAEELDIAPQKIEYRFAGVHEDYNNPDFGMQLTGGSTSIKAHYYPLRQVGANVRALLIQAAAADLGVSAQEISTDDGHIVAAGQRYPYGQFVATAGTLPVVEEAPLKPKARFKYIGKEFSRLDAMAKSTGTAEYGIDVDVPGMLYAVVVRSPVAGGSVASIDSTTAAAMPGISQILQIDTGVAVVAEKFWQAKQAAAQLKVEWDSPELAQFDSARIKADYQTAMNEEAGDSGADAGDVSAALAQAEQTLEAEYYAPYLAHAPLEPMNAVVRIENGEADLWTGNQAPTAARGLVARYADIDTARVRAHNTYQGGAFGRRATLTHVVEATQLAVATGKPIKLVWTREDDMRHGVFRPASLMKIKAAVDSEGAITAWQAKRVGGNITPDTLGFALPGLLPAAVPTGVTQWMAGVSDSLFSSWMVDHPSIEGLFEDYDFPNHEVLHVTRDHGLPLTFWRSVGHSYTAFAKEAMIDELAAQAGVDPIAMRLRNTQNNPRLAGVIKAVQERMGMLGQQNGRHVGFAAHGSFGSYVAQAAEVSIENGKIKVHKVICAVDCGQVINPDIVRGQMEGSIMFGLTATLHGQILLDKGAVKESNFHDYPILRMNEAPEVETIIVDSEEDPSGVGEPGLPPIAPAIANAVYAATGQRLRNLPLSLS